MCNDIHDVENEILRKKMLCIVLCWNLKKHAEIIIEIS